jgi:hypothetical protein
VGRSRKEPSGTYWFDGARLKKKSGFSIIVHAPTALAPSPAPVRAGSSEKTSCTPATTPPAEGLATTYMVG